MTTPVKKCGKCGVELVVGDNWRPGLARRSRYTCSACASTREKAWRVANWESASASGKAWYAANLKSRRAYNKARYWANIERTRAINNTRAAVRRGATLPPGQTAAEAAEACRYIYKEAQRLTAETGLTYQVDHVVPCADGGLHAPENLRVVPAYINMRKQAQDNDAFLARYFAGEVNLADDLPEEHVNLIIDHLEAEAIACGETLDIETLLTLTSPREDS